MKDELTLIALVLFICSLLVVVNIYQPLEPVQINCRLTDPDWPPAVKESCRIKNEQ